MNQKAQPTTTDAFEKWILAAPIATQLAISNSIAYWLEMKKAHHPLLQMALDYLTVPSMCVCISPSGLLIDATFTATSTDVEHAFLHGELTVFKLHHSLTNKSTHFLFVLGSNSWFYFI